MWHTTRAHEGKCAHRHGRRAGSSFMNESCVVRGANACVQADIGNAVYPVLVMENRLPNE